MSSMRVSHCIISTFRFASLRKTVNGKVCTVYSVWWNLANDTGQWPVVSSAHLLAPSPLCTRPAPGQLRTQITKWSATIPCAYSSCPERTKAYTDTDTHLCVSLGIKGPEWKAAEKFLLPFKGQGHWHCQLGTCRRLLQVTHCRCVSQIS